jgi:hypothetical protein
MTARLSSLTAAARQAGGPDRAACWSPKLAANARPEEELIMARTARRMLLAAALGAVLAVPVARAQDPGLQPAPAAAGLQTAPAATNAPARSDLSQLVDDLPAPMPGSGTPGDMQQWQPDFLKSMPQPPAEPRSLYQPAPGIGPPPLNLEHYWQLDPLLDPPQWGQRPGLFWDVRVDLIHPQLFFGGMKSVVTTPSGERIRVAPGAADLSWTAAPRLEIGYRLPSGFGGFAFSDRFFSSSGNGPFTGPAGMVARTSHLGVNYSDWDYISRDYTPWSNENAIWTLEWRAGIRLAETWITNRVDQSFGNAAAGTGVFIAGDSNYTVGAGPHFGLVVDRKNPQNGLSLVLKLDVANTFTRVQQQFAAATTMLNAVGQPQRGIFTQNFWQQVPILNYQVGVGWQPPSYPNFKVYVGYVYEFWWQIASNSNIAPTVINTLVPGNSRGFFNNQGVVLQAGFNW